MEETRVGDLSLDAGWMVQGLRRGVSLVAKC